MTVAHQRPDEAVPASGHTRSAWAAELRDTLWLAWPLIAAQLAQMLILTSDVVLIGMLGPGELAAATLAVALLHPFQLFGVGVAAACAPMIAQALAARDLRSVRRSARAGFWACALVFAGVAPMILGLRPVLLALGQEAETSRLVEVYLQAAVFSVLPALLFIVTRSLLAAHGRTGIILVITLGCILLNILGNWLLMFGPFGLPRLGLAGSGIATSVTNAVMFLLSLAVVLRDTRMKRYGILVRLWRPDWTRLWRILTMGVPIGLTLTAETGMFAGAALMMGWLGTEALAGHAAAMQWAALAFMVPLGLGHATTVRVGAAQGRGDAAGVSRAGWVSIGIGIGFMGLAALLFVAVPDRLAGVFLDADDPAARVSLALAVSYLGVAALFQLADGAQVVTAAALRGLGDTAWPMAVAIVGYWLVGLPLAYLCGFVLDLKGVGIWLGLAGGLATVSAVLLARFAFRERLGLLDVRLG